MSTLQTRSLDMVAAEIRTFTASVLTNIIEIGRRLTEAKMMVDHGGFLAWVKDNTGYSQSTANNFMRIYDEYGTAQGSLFGDTLKSQTFGNLSYSKALALLSVPTEEREQFAAENNVEAMTTRELQQAIRERDELKKRIETMGDELATAQDNVGSLTMDRDRITSELNELRNRPQEIIVENADPQKIENAVKAALAAADKKHAAEISKLNKTVSASAAELVKLRTASEAAEKKAQEAEKNSAGNAEAYRQEAEHLRRQLAMADPVTAEFKGLFEQTSAAAVKLLRLAAAAPEDTRPKLRAALRALGEQLKGGDDAL